MEYCLNVPLVTQLGIGAHAPDGGSTPRGEHEVIDSVSIPTLKANEGLVGPCKGSCSRG